MATAQAGAAAKGGGADSARSVETPANAQQRSEQAATGSTPAALPRTPK